MTDKEAIEIARGKNLETPTYEVRVFHVSNPKYTYSFVRQEGSEVLVVDDNNDESDDKHTLKMFPASELVNVVVFTNTLLRGNETPLPRPPSDLKFWEELKKMPGGDNNPFEVSVGPTKMCLSSNQVVLFVESGEKDEYINQHLGNCEECLTRVNRFKAVRSYYAFGFVRRTQ